MHHTGKTYDIIKYTDPWYLRKEIHKQKHNKVLTVLAPVIWAKASCNLLPSSCSSSSMTLYVAPISLNTLFAILQYGHVVLENITTQCCDTNSWKVWEKKKYGLYHFSIHVHITVHTLTQKFGIFGWNLRKNFTLQWYHVMMKVVVEGCTADFLISNHSLKEKFTTMVGTPQPKSQWQGTGDPVLGVVLVSRCPNVNAVMGTTVSTPAPIKPEQL